MFVTEQVYSDPSVVLTTFAGSCRVRSDASPPGGGRSAPKEAVALRLRARPRGSEEVRSTLDRSRTAAAAAPFLRRPPRESRGVPALGERQPVVRDASGSTRGRAFSGLALVFSLSFVNLVGILVTATALGGIAPWTRWQFIGMFGVVELGSGLANVLSPNIWRLPVAELQTSKRTDVKLAASALLLPHWGGLARAGAGLAFVILAAWQEGVAPVSLLLVPLVLALAWFVLAVSAALARAGVARPDVDVVQFVVRWGRRQRELTPISVCASVFQFLLTIVTLPVAKLLPPSILYQPEIGPSPAALVVLLGLCAGSSAVAYLAWSNRVVIHAPAEQQREAEAKS